MARFSLALTTAAALLAAPAFAQQTPPEGTDWKALLIETIEANGCAMTEEEAATKLPPLGFVQEWTGALVEEMVAEGSATLDETTWSVRVKTEKCG